MNRTLVALWVIIASSIVTIVALAFVWNHERETNAHLEYASLLRRQLEPYNRDLAAVFEAYDRTLQQALEGFDPSSSAAIARLERGPLVGLLVVVGDDGAKGQLIYPTLASTQLADRSLVTDALVWMRDSNFSQRTRASNSYNTLPLVDPPAQNRMDVTSSASTSQSAGIQFPAPTQPSVPSQPSLAAQPLNASQHRDPPSAQYLGFGQARPCVRVPRRHLNHHGLLRHLTSRSGLPTPLSIHNGRLGITGEVWCLDTGPRVCKTL